MRGEVASGRGGGRDESGDLKRNHCKKKKKHHCNRYNVAGADWERRRKMCREKTQHGWVQSVQGYTAQCQRRESLRAEEVTVAMEYENMNNVKEMSRKQKTKTENEKKKVQSTWVERENSTLEF